MDYVAYYAPHKNEETAEDDVSMERAEFTWDADRGSFRLADINLKVKKGHFVGVVGRVGSGKSSLLQAITGDLVRLKGCVSVSDPQNRKGCFHLSNSEINGFRSVQA